MSDSQDFKEGEFHGRVIGELEALKIGQTNLQTSLDQLKNGMGATLQAHDREIVELKTGHALLSKIMLLVGTVAITALGGALFKLALK